MQIIFIILTSIFLYINLKIVYKDLKDKLILNKFLVYLLYLLPFYYLYLFLDNQTTNYSVFFIHFILAFVVSFFIFYFWLWWAWDAKYLLVLSLFIINHSILNFVWNLALVIIIYLLSYFIWFYLWNKKWVFRSMYIDLKWKWEAYKINKQKSDFSIILNRSILFLIIFVSIRLSRFYIIGYFLWKNQNSDFVNKLIENYSIYIIVSIIILSLLIIWLIKKLIWKIKTYLKIYVINKYKINSKYFEIIFTYTLLVLLLSFIVYEYIKDKEDLLKQLSLIFSIYIFIYIIFKIFKYLYKITFEVNDTKFIDVSKLKWWQIVDKKYLIDLFWEQSCLWAYGNKWILAPDPLKYFKSIENPIDKNTSQNLKKIFKIVNNHHKKQNENYIENKLIKVYKTFALSPFIFLAFIITYIFWDYFIKNSLLLVSDLLKRIYN